MQVAMIAQGEFMELLRAKSDDKKMIFRKLFHTGLYEEIKNEFAVRKKEKQAEIDQIRMRCIAEISRTELPEGLEQTAFLKEKKKELGKIKRFFGNGPGAVSGETGTSVRGAFEADERSKKDRAKEKSGT